MNTVDTILWAETKVRRVTIDILQHLVKAVDPVSVVPCRQFRIWQPYRGSWLLESDTKVFWSVFKSGLAYSPWASITDLMTLALDRSFAGGIESTVARANTAACDVSADDVIFIKSTDEMLELFEVHIHPSPSAMRFTGR